MGQVVACAPVTQRARVRSPVGTSFLGEVFRGFSSPVRQMLGSFRLQGPRISFGHHNHTYSFITGANDLRYWRALKKPQIYKYTIPMNQKDMNIHSLPEFNLPHIGAFTWHTPPGLYRATTCRKKKLTLDHIHTFWPQEDMRGLPGRGSAQFPGYLRDNTNRKDDTHHSRSHPFEQGEYEMMIMTAKWYSETLWT